MNDKIIDKIKKMLALSANNPNANEAEQAMRMAKKLLDKHNLTMLHLKNEGDEVEVISKKYKSQPYVRIVYNAIAELYDCKYLIQKHTKPPTHLLIGTESNRTTAIIIIFYVLDEIWENSTGKGNGYRNAAAFAIQDKVDTILAERAKDTEEVIPGTGLLPVDASTQALADVDDFISNKWGKINKSPKKNVGYDHRGEALGKRINLNPHLSNKKALN